MFFELSRPYLLVILIIVAQLFLTHDPAIAGTCDCEQHDASSTSAASSCTVAENSSKCSITHGNSASRTYNFDRERLPRIDELEELAADGLPGSLNVPDIPFREALRNTAMSGQNALGDTLLLEMWFAAVSADELDGGSEFTDLVRELFEFRDRKEVQFEIAIELLENGCWRVGDGFAQMTYWVDMNSRDPFDRSC